MEILGAEHIDIFDIDGAGMCGTRENLLNFVVAIDNAGGFINASMKGFSQLASVAYMVHFS
jgi:hypothetical protein